MSVLSILKMGNPILQQKARSVDSFDKSLECLINNMIETMDAHNGAGIAAPQVGESLQVIIFGVDYNPRYPNASEVPFTVLVNPVITVVDDELEEGWEGCLSLPGLRGLVPRYKSIRYSGYDANGHAIEREAKGFHARVVQHEVDHLQGILYPQRMTSLTHFGFEDELFQT